MKNTLEKFFHRARYTWEIMPVWAKVADGLIIIGLIAAAVWLLD